MKTPKDRARDKRRSPNVENERDRRRAHLAAGGTIANYDTSHYAYSAPEGFFTHTPETLDEMDRLAEAGHKSMEHKEGTENLLDKSSQSKPPF